MLSFINHIKIKTPKEDDLRSLNDEEREKIFPLFFRKSKKTFNFEDIAKKLAPKKLYGFYKKATDAEMPYLFKIVNLLKTEDTHPPKTGISVHFSGSLV